MTKPKLVPLLLVVALATIGIAACRPESAEPQPDLQATITALEARSAQGSPPPTAVPTGPNLQATIEALEARSAPESQPTHCCSYRTQLGGDYHGPGKPDPAGGTGTHGHPSPARKPAFKRPSKHWKPVFRTPRELRNQQRPRNQRPPRQRLKLPRIPAGTPS